MWKEITKISTMGIQTYEYQSYLSKWRVIHIGLTQIVSHPIQIRKTYSLPQIYSFPNGQKDKVFTNNWKKDSCYIIQVQHISFHVCTNINQWIQNTTICLSKIWNLNMPIIFYNNDTSENIKPMVYAHFL